MPESNSAPPKASTKAVEKAKAIQLAVEQYQDPSNSLSMREIALFFNISKTSIANHLDDTPKHKYGPEVYAERQALSPAEESALVAHILDCRSSGLAFDVPLLNYLANDLLRMKGVDRPVGDNWHLNFYRRHPEAKTSAARPADKNQLANEESDDYIRWLQLLIEAKKFPYRPSEPIEPQSSNCPITPQDQIVISHGLMNVRFSIANARHIKNMVDRLASTAPSAVFYKTQLKAYIENQEATAIVRDAQMDDLRTTAADKKRSKETTGCTIMDPERWAIIQAAERESQRAKSNELARKKDSTANRKVTAAATKADKAQTREAPAQNKAAGKAASKKSAKKAPIDPDESIHLLFESVEETEANEEEAEATTSSTNEAITSRSRPKRAVRAPGRLRSS